MSSKAMNYFSSNTWQKHNEVVYEARAFSNKESCLELISYMVTNDSTCPQHPHEEHVHGDQKPTDTFFWQAECFDKAGQEDQPLSSIHGIARTVHEMEDAATRYTSKPMKLAKVIFHRYGPGASGPEHTDVYPLATLLYLNDDYEGGEIYFSSGLELKPEEGSLLVFDGGGVNKHGVRQNTGSTPRYVLVAFWEYEEEHELVNFWNKENGHVADNSEDNILFADKFPVLVVKNFISQELSDNLLEFFRVNDMNPEETYGPICFREYWAAAYPDRISEEPEYTNGIDKDTLVDINNKIKEHVVSFLGHEDDQIVFSKFKAHNHTAGSYSPPHTHPPAVAVAQIVLSSGFSGGKIEIPSYGISIDAEPLSLYVYSEDNDLKHGISKVEYGDRRSLVSHWQPKDHPYKNAGANI
jgi:hypothetical protein